MTSSSLPEIGKAFGSRDHTTVLHAHRLMIDLIEQDPMIKEDYSTLYGYYPLKPNWRYLWNLLSHEEILTPLNQIIGAVERKMTFSILANIKVEVLANEKKLVLTTQS